MLNKQAIHLPLSLNSRSKNPFKATRSNQNRKVIIHCTDAKQKQAIQFKDASKQL